MGKQYWRSSPGPQVRLIVAMEPRRSKKIKLRRVSPRPPLRRSSVGMSVQSTFDCELAPLRYVAQKQDCTNDRTTGAFQWPRSDRDDRSGRYRILDAELYLHEWIAVHCTAERILPPKVASRRRPDRAHRSRAKLPRGRRAPPNKRLASVSQSRVRPSRVIASAPSPVASKIEFRIRVVGTQEA